MVYNNLALTSARVARTEVPWNNGYLAPNTNPYKVPYPHRPLSPTITNDTTKQILNFLFENRIFAWRNSVGAGETSYTNKAGITKTRYMQMGKVGSPDIMGYLPPTGRGFGIEIKTGKDRLSPEQIGFHHNANKMGALILVVKDYEDFLKQWKALPLSRDSQ